jgi:molybdopterin-guanine dinucleotide biosynthesis protein A
MIKIPCVILAGGKSSRMKEDKALLSFGQYDTLIQYQYEKLSLIFENVYISSKVDKFVFLKNKNSIIYDKDNISSPMVALKYIFQTIKSSKVFIISVDTPLVLEQTIHSLINNSQSFDITIAQTKDKTHNLCGVFSISLATKTSKCIEKGIHKINYLIKQSNTNYINFKDEIQFLNINTKEDYAKAMLL